MDRGGIRLGIHNFFVSLVLVPIFVFKFIITWLTANSIINKASEKFNEKMLKMGLAEGKIKTLTREYRSVKDYIFEGFYCMYRLAWGGSYHR